MSDLTWGEETCFDAGKKEGLLEAADEIAALKVHFERMRDDFLYVALEQDMLPEARMDMFNAATLSTPAQSFTAHNASIRKEGLLSGANLTNDESFLQAPPEWLPNERYAYNKGVMDYSNALRKLANDE